MLAQIPAEQFKQGLEGAGLPPHIVLDILEVFLAWDEFGCPYFSGFRLTILLTRAISQGKSRPSLRVWRDALIRGLIS